MAFASRSRSELNPRRPRALPPSRSYESEAYRSTTEGVYSGNRQNKKKTASNLDSNLLCQCQSRRRTFWPVEEGKSSQVHKNFTSRTFQFTTNIRRLLLLASAGKTKKPLFFGLYPCVVPTIFSPSEKVTSIVSPWFPSSIFLGLFVLAVSPELFDEEH